METFWRFHRVTSAGNCSCTADASRLANCVRETVCQEFHPLTGEFTRWWDRISVVIRRKLTKARLAPTRTGIKLAQRRDKLVQRDQSLSLVASFRESHYKRPRRKTVPKRKRPPSFIDDYVCLVQFPSSFSRSELTFPPTSQSKSNLIFSLGCIISTKHQLPTTTIITHYHLSSSSSYSSQWILHSPPLQPCAAKKSLATSSSTL